MSDIPKEKIDELTPELFLDGPAEFLAHYVVEVLKATPQWTAIFGEFIDSYKRMDYPQSCLPALRVYENGYKKEFESWFIDGNLNLDIILPASVRREGLQRIPDQLSAAMLQQFRRPKFFTAVNDKMPGLNKLGASFEVDKSLGFEWGDQVVPLTQITVNFRIDLREWDLHLEQTNRTKDDPFEETLGKLQRLVGKIQGLKDDNSVQVEIPVDQKTEE